MLIFAFVVNPIIVYAKLRRNPYPLVWKCISTSGVTAFFTRSSAANIPVNMALAKELGIDPDTYTVTVPLGATINMSGAAITISIMTLAAVHTLGIAVDFPTALLLSVLSAIGACGASGVAGGSLLLIPMACSLFGISNDIAMQVVGVGFIIGVFRTRRKRLSTRRQTSCLRQLLIFLNDHRKALPAIKKLQESDFSPVLEGFVVETLFNDVGGDDFGVVSRVAVSVGHVEAAVDVLGIEFVVNIFR